MKLHDSGDFTALSWVKPALDATLAQARESLEAYVDEPGNLEPMRTCVAHLHQVQGTLRMVELYGAAMVVENMERLAEGVVAGTVKQREESYSVLMRGMVQLPDYLERLQSGHKDIPIVLLPLLNDLRACRGENLMTESALFSPDLGVVLPAAADGAPEQLATGDLRAQALRLRLGFQAALLKWFRDEHAAEHPRRLIDVLDRLRAVSYGADARRLWWIAAGVIDAAANGGLEASVAVKLLFGRVDREIHRFATTGEAAFAAAPPRELTKNLLYYVAHSTGNSARGSAIRSAYRLDTLLPTAGELQHAQGSMTGRNRNLLGTVSTAIKDDLLRVKEALDIFLRSGNPDASELAGQVEVLDRVGDTLGMLGLGVPRRVVGEQRGFIEEMADRRRPIDEGTLLDVAGALLYVEASLDDHIERLGATGEGEMTTGELELPQAEVRKILDALMREAAVNIQQAKQDIIAFIESPWDHERVTQIPRLLEEIVGALRMLGLNDAAELMTAIVRFVEVELTAHRRVPTAEQMDQLADALAAIEYYLEATREQRRNREKILDVARESLAALGYWPLPPMPEFSAAHAGNATPAATGAASPAASAFDLHAVADLAYGGAQADHDAASTLHPTIDLLPGHDLHDLVIGDARMPELAGHDLAGLRLAETGATAESDWVEVEEEIEEEVPADLHAVAGFQHAAGEEIDDDIRDVFLEEVEDEIANLRRQVPVWKRDVENLDELKPIRRSFHTLKGSGRLVGALALGEFSWKVESLLNRVLDRSIPPGNAVVALVDHAVDAVPALLGALRGEHVGSDNVASIMDTADRLAAGEEAWVAARSSATRTVRRTVRRRVPAAQRELPALRGDIHSTGNLVGDDHFGASPPELIAGPLPNIDPVLFDILQSEVAAHLGVVDDYLTRCEPEPALASEGLLRAVHTLNGAIAMVDIPAIGNALAPLESYIKRLRGAAVAPGKEGVDALRETVALTQDVMQRLEAHRRDLPDSSALVARIAALRDALPEPEASLPLYDGTVVVAEPTMDPVKDTAAEHEAEFAVAQDDDAPATESLAPATGLTPSDTDFAGAWLDDAIAAHGIDQDAPRETAIPVELVTSLIGFDAHATGAAHLDDIPAVAQDSAFEAIFGGLPSMAEPPAFDATVRDALDHVEAAHAHEPAPTELAGEIAEIEVPAEASSHLSVAPGEAHAGHVEPARDSIEHEASTLVVASAHDAVPAEIELAPDFGAEMETPVEASDEAHVEPPAAHTPRAAALLSGREAPPIADDPQPDGPFEAIDIDDDLLDIFAQEGADILDHADSLVANLREAPHERAAIVGLQRDLHTLKGGARMANLAPIGDLSHAMESLVDAVSDGRLAVDRVAVESLERGFDRLHVLVQRVAHRRAIAMPVHAIARFESLVAGDALAEAAAHAQPAEVEVAPAPAAPAEAAAPAAAPVVRPAPRHLTAMDQEEPAHAPQEMIRVRSDLLDSLVNYAGEVSIYRSRLEQQISTFRFNLVEFDQTVARLREQLRKLEIETEAQIIARYQREQHEEGVFDPLELDRFSQLQQLSRALGESVSDLVSIQGLLDDQTRQSETLLLQQSRVSSDLQEGLMRTRMVPFDSLVPNLRRTLRQAAQEVGKRAQLKVDGAQGEMDRNLLERMKAPFEHMLRNALAHGIEKPEDRVAAGKPAEGTVNIAVSRESTEVVLRIADDGRGMDRDAIRRKAIDRGLLKPEVQLSDRDLYGFVLETGFSTAEQVTQLAGRGVGMDVVHNEIKQLGGSLAIDSTHGTGTQFTIRLPFTLAVTQAILVKLGESSYAIPMSSVQGVARIARDDLERRIAEGNPKHAYAGEEYTIYDLAQLLGVQRARAGDETQVPLLMTRTGDQRAAVRIDGVVGSREVVVKSVGPQVSSVPGIFGATIMGDGSVVIILDLAPLVRRLAALRARIDAGAEESPAYMAAAPAHVPETRQKPLVMVVDDSITMRKVTTRVLERADFEVMTAKDGLDAVEKLQDNVPDLMLLDIEMPRMDGYELATYMRNDPRLRQVPIIMVTSRTGEKHRQRALEIGVERYLGKPYQEDDLLRHVQETLRRDRG
ncbi:Hpt domain-containing protein [Dokdonella soli]|uniref:histidine kinase n=1 Tax=Dokdonella soli TaxID=529810 RepID=A0ABN1II89_9GAMM